MNSFLKKTFCFLLVSCLCVLAASLFLKVNAVNYEAVMTEKFEDYATSTTYNTTKTYEDKWTVYYGTVSTTDALTGSKSCQMRWYKSALANRPYAIYTFASAQNVDKIAFNYRVQDTGIHYTVQYSSDGNSFTDDPGGEFLPA